MYKTHSYYTHIAYTVVCVVCLCLALALTACGGKQPFTPDNNDKADRVLNTAYSQVGKQYRLGGASPQKGFDCSGFIWWAYQQHGITVPRITRDQASVGKSVAQSKAAPGDILVFRTRNAPNGLHTALYSGNGAFIHSPRKGQTVREEKLDSDHWKGKLLAVRRVLE